MRCHRSGCGLGIPQQHPTKNKVKHQNNYLRDQGTSAIPDLASLGQQWRQMRFNPLRSLTPARLAAALDGHAAGWLRDGALIFEAIEAREAIVRSVMVKRRAAVARRDWQVITPDPEHPNAEAHKATLEYFYNNLSVTDATDLNVRSGMSGLLRQMASHTLATPGV